MSQKNRIIVIGFAVFMIALGTAYSWAWQETANAVATSITELTIPGAESVSLVSLEKTGFPGAPTIISSLQMTFPLAEITVPEARVKGFFLPGSEAQLYLPYGYDIAPRLRGLDLFFPEPDTALLRLSLPNSVPAAFTENALASWRDQADEIEIYEAAIGFAGTTLSFAGLLFLDEALQPAGSGTLRVTSSDNFAALTQATGLNPDAFIMAARLAGDITESHENGVQDISLPIKIEDRYVTLGRLKLFQIQPLNWTRLTSGNADSPVEPDSAPAPTQ